jgi:hypothetical protein
MPLFNVAVRVDFDFEIEAETEEEAEAQGWYWEDHCNYGEVYSIRVDEVIEEDEEDLDMSQSDMIESPIPN